MVKVELGATVLLEHRGEWKDVADSPLWHVQGDEPTHALCGLPGTAFPYRGESIRERRACKVCLARAPARLVAPEGESEYVPDGRTGAQRRISDDQLRLLFRLYEEQGLSAYKVADQVWKQFGYTSAKSCSIALYDGWKALGFEMRDRIEATIIASTIHGKAPRRGGRAGYKRWLREQRGETVGRKCEATTSKGKPCPRDAKNGLPWCASHDPAKREAIVANLARMRTKTPRQRPENLTTVSEVQEDLRAYREAGGTWAVLARECGHTNTQLIRWLKAPPEQRMMKTTAERIRRGLVAATADMYTLTRTSADAA